MSGNPGSGSRTWRGSGKKVRKRDETRSRGGGWSAVRVDVDKRGPDVRGSQQQRHLVELIAIAEELSRTGRGEVDLRFTQVIEKGLHRYDDEQRAVFGINRTYR